MPVGSSQARRVRGPGAGEDKTSKTHAGWEPSGARPARNCVALRCRRAGGSPTASCGRPPAPGRLIRPTLAGSAGGAGSQRRLAELGGESGGLHLGWFVVQTNTPTRSARWAGRTSSRFCSDEDGFYAGNSLQQRQLLANSTSPCGKQSDVRIERSAPDCDRRRQARNSHGMACVHFALLLHCCSTRLEAHHPASHR